MSLRQTLTDVVFSRLRKQKITCRANFSCCGGCASGEIHEIAKKANAVGVVYWHQQDDARMKDDKNEGVYLGFGAVEGGPLTTEQVGQIVVKELENAGAKVEWDGTEASRIYVEATDHLEARPAKVLPRRPVGVRIELVPALAANRTIVVNDAPEEESAKPELRLVGEDGNAFSILGRAAKAWRKAGKADLEWLKIRQEATSGNYDKLLQTMMKHFEAI